MRKTHGGNGMTECNPYKYGLFLCIYFVLFFCVYTTNLEINGFISLFFVNLFISFLLSSDLANIEMHVYNLDHRFKMFLGLMNTAIATTL